MNELIKRLIGVAGVASLVLAASAVLPGASAKAAPLISASQFVASLERQRAVRLGIQPVGSQRRPYGAAIRGGRVDRSGRTVQRARRVARQRAFAVRPTGLQEPGYRRGLRPFIFAERIDRRPPPVVVVIEQTAPVQPAEVDVQPPLDPRGAFERQSIFQSDTRYGVGDRVARRQPRVRLDWRQYDLPRPGAGESYVRIQGTVLRIDSATREVLAVLDPSASQG
ncbi:MAG: RcnB family protein [Pseudomonadota bacterium]